MMLFLSKVLYCFRSEQAFEKEKKNQNRRTLHRYVNMHQAINVNFTNNLLYPYAERGFQMSLPSARHQDGAG
jgi:hypothetical protein